MKISTSPVAAKEDAITDAMVTYQRLFDESENQPQFSPKEIAAIYPNLNRNANAQALRRVANASGTPRGKHLAKVVARIDKLRGNEAYGAWKEFQEAFPGTSLEDRQKYFIDVLTLWCLPASAEVASKAVEELKADHSNPYEAELFADPLSLTVEKVDEIGRKAYKKEGELNKIVKTKYRDFIPAYIETDLLHLQALNSAIDQIFAIWEHRCYDLWDEIKDVYSKGTSNNSDAADRIIALMRVFYKA